MASLSLYVSGDDVEFDPYQNDWSDVVSFGVSFDADVERSEGLINPRVAITYSLYINGTLVEESGANFYFSGNYGYMGDSLSIHIPYSNVRSMDVYIEAQGFIDADNADVRAEDGGSGEWSIELLNYVFSVTPSYLYTLSNPLMVPSSGATAVISGNVSGVLYDDYNDITRNIPNNAITRPNLSITYNQADNTDVVVRSYTYEDAGGNVYSAPLNIYVKQVRPASIKVIGVDSNVYYAGRSNTFRVPAGQTFKVVFNDGTEIDLTPTDFTYRKGASVDAEQLVVGQSYTNEQLPYIYFQHTVTYGGGTFVIFGQYEVQYTPDVITSVSITAVNSITYGNFLTKDDFTVTATYQSTSTEVLDVEDYSIVSPISRIMSAISSIQLLVRGANFTVNSPVFTYVTPTLKVADCEIVGELITAYNNNLSMIDLSNIKIKTAYNGTDYSNLLPISDTLAAGDDEYSVVAKKHSGGSWSNIFNSEAIGNYNGTTVLEISELTNGSMSCKFVFSFVSIFDNADGVTMDVDFSVLAMTEIKGISIVNPYTEYHVGETFLNENDTTEVAIYWEDNGALNYKIIPLSSGYTSISVFPQKGYEFVNVDASKQITVKSVLNSNVYAEYTVKVLPENQSSTTSIHDLVAIWSPTAILPTIPVSSYTPENGKGVLLLYEDSDTLVVNGTRILVNQHAHCYGYIDNILDKNLQAKVVLFDDYLPEIDGSANMEITFPCYAEGEADLINACSFGCLFGANNSVNRLFVSGNKEVANADWHTAELNLTDYEGDIERENGNFSYIPSETIMYYGETDNAICGYEVIANDKLLVLKTSSDKEKTVYFRVPITVKSIDAAGSVSTDVEGNTLYQEEFGLVKGNNSVAGISPTTIVNFNGDTLFVDSDNQVSGLDLVGIVGDNQRYANSRSKLIDQALKGMDLSKSTLWTNNKYLFLSVKDVGLFVAQFEAKTETQYEWWFLSSHNPSVFIEVDGEIYFGNDDGNFCKLFNGIHEDIKKIFVGKEQILLISLLPDEERVLTEKAVIDQLKQTEHYVFQPIEDKEHYTANIYFKSALMRESGTGMDVRIDYEKNTLVVINNDISLFENTKYYLNCVEEDVEERGNRNIDCDEDSEFEVYGAPYTLKQVDVDDENYDDSYPSFYLLNADGEETDLSELHNAVLCEKLVTEVNIGDIDYDRATFGLYRDGKELDIITYGAQNPAERQVKAEIKEFAGIEAYYITSPMFSNTLNTFKTIWQIVLTNDTAIKSTLQVGIASNKVPYVKSKTLAAISKGGMGISFEDLIFSRADFDKNVVPRTYNIQKVLGMQKFICFAFKNQKGNNAVLSEMAITYTLPFPSYGSD